MDNYVNDYKSPRQMEHEKLYKIYPWLKNRRHRHALYAIQGLNENQCFKLLSIIYSLRAGKTDIKFCEFCKIVEFLQPKVAKDYNEYIKEKS